jgi:spore coat protein A
MITRRQFLKASVLTGAGLLAPLKGARAAPAMAPPAALTAKPAYAAATAASPNLTRWLDKLPIPPALAPDTSTYPGKDYYEISMEQRSWRFHSQLNAAPSWGYWSGSTGIGYLGPTIVAQEGRPVVVKYTNNLPSTHLLSNSIDTTLHSMEGLSSESRAVPHLHGGFTAPQFDGHPDAWFSPTGKHGEDYHTMDGAAGNEAIFGYSNAQPACMLWYHDHAMGITRLNAYAGLAAGYIIRDSRDTGLPNNPLGLPAAPYEVPIIIQDKLLRPNGAMFYPTTSDIDDPYPHPIWVPEFFGDTPVVNGKAYPYLEVEPRRYRLRFLNGSQARFYNIWFENTKKNVRYPFWLIGMEQSLLPAPVRLNSLLLSPAERGDVIFDFAQVPAGTTLTLKNNAKAPYPGGRGGAVGQIVQFRVVKQLSGRDTTTPPGQLVLPEVPRLKPTPGAPLREIVMKETMSPVTGDPTDVRLNGKWFSGPEDDSDVVDEQPKEGDTEIWQFINLTVDAHPMHMHLVQFQVYDRQPFDAAAYAAAWLAGQHPALADYFTGPSMAPPAGERGWKDTVKALPGQITRIIAKFDVPEGSAIDERYGGYDYVYHCHILEHEENEMMRPFVVQP